MQNDNPRHTPLPEKGYFEPLHEDKAMDSILSLTYRQIVGDFRYIADSTGFDIFYPVKKLASILHAPAVAHRALLKWLLKYLKQITNPGILYTSEQHAPTCSILKSIQTQTMQISATESQTQASYTPCTAT